MEALKKNHNKYISLKQAEKIVIILIFALFFEFLMFPLPALAGQIAESADLSQNSQQVVEVELNGKLPDSENTAVKWSTRIVITAYNSEAGQTDDSPCITANNFNVCEHGAEDTIATNFLPFGAKVKIPDLFGDRVFIVRDRMNRRYHNRVDIWMVEKPDALNFGVKLAVVQVLQ